MKKLIFALPIILALAGCVVTPYAYEPETVYVPSYVMLGVEGYWINGRYYHGRYNGQRLYRPYRDFHPYPRNLLNPQKPHRHH